MTAEQAPVPVTIVGGYLGAGKTTLVNHLLRNANGLRLAILVNDFGELPIDADLIEAEDGDVISLTGGCVCCSYGNDLIMAMMDMAKMEPRPDHIVLEASGVALPDAVANSVSLLDGYALDGILVLADSETIVERSGDKYMADTIFRQLEFANIILLNKTDLVDAAKLANAQKFLEEHAGQAIVVETHKAQVPLSVALQSHHVELPLQLLSPHKLSSTFETRHLNMENAVEPETLAQKITTHEPPIIRAKGFVKSKDGTMKTVQTVGKRWQVIDAPDSVEAGLVVIGVQLSNAKKLAADLLG